MPDRPLRADARRNRDKVLRAARDAFAVGGIGVPLDEIAARAGVGPGTVYRHFPTKEALFQAVITVRIEDLIADAQARTVGRLRRRGEPRSAVNIGSATAIAALATIVMTVTTT